MNSHPDGGEPFRPDAIITLPVAIEDEVHEQPVEERQSIKEPADASSDDQARSKPSSGHPDVDNLFNEGLKLINDPGRQAGVILPPKALEISWPDTRGLKQCLGESIALRIHVDSEGNILQIVVVDKNHPQVCVDAAMETAKKIVFTPGTIDGKTANMWTQIRIDFRPQN